MRSRVQFSVLPWEFFLAGKDSRVTMVWVVSRLRLKAPPGISSSCISPLTSSGQRSRASWASHPHKSATLSPKPGGKPRKFIRTCSGIGGVGWVGRLLTSFHFLKFSFHSPLLPFSSSLSLAWRQSVISSFYFHPFALQSSITSCSLPFPWSSFFIPRQKLNPQDQQHCC